MHRLLEFLKSDTFGFLLKLFAGLAAAAFGVLGIGTKTRDDHGKLTRNGRIALTGILLAAFFAIANSIYDFVEEQQQARVQRHRSEQLLTSVQKGLYPFTVANISLEIELRPEFGPLLLYRNHLQQRFRDKPNCGRGGAEFECVPAGFHIATNYYKIPRTSPLFPRPGSPAYGILSNLGVTISVFKSSQDGTIYTPAGSFFVLLHDRAPDVIYLLYETIRGRLWLIIKGAHMSSNFGEDLDKTGIYSIADFDPGLLSFDLQLQDNVCNDLNLRPIPCGVLQSRVKNRLIIDEIDLQFPYPREITAHAEYSILCKTPAGPILNLPIIDDLDTTTWLSDYPEDRYSTEVRRAVCRAVNGFPGSY